ncbi:MAG: hypothetical protein WC389_22150 [Lutibacter sp.]|jgi:hypothetical protein
MARLNLWRGNTMGWTSKNATYYTKQGRIDIIKEVCQNYSWENETDVFHVLKAQAIGCQVYLAVEMTTKTNNKKQVFGVVVLTSTNMKDDFNFSEKAIEETMPEKYSKTFDRNK